jgi:hypothetical protein
MIPCLRQIALLAVVQALVGCIHSWNLERCRIARRETILEGNDCADRHDKFAEHPDGPWFCYRYRNHQDLLDEVGEVDSPEDAALVLWSEGHHFQCSAPLRRVADGYEVVYEAGNCCPTTSRYHVHVGTNGTVELLESTLLCRSECVE